MKGKHIRKEKKSIVWILIALFVLIGVIFGYFHFKSDDQEDLSQYETIVGTIKNVGDETLLIETNDHQKYLISIAGAIESNKGLIKGNRIYIYYEGTLDIKNKDIKDISDIKSTPVGDKYVIVLTIYVDGNMKTFDSHKLADNLEKDVNKLEKVYRTIVHVEPV